MTQLKQRPNQICALGTFKTNEINSCHFISFVADVIVGSCKLSIIICIFGVPCVIQYILCRNMILNCKHE